MKKELRSLLSLGLFCAVLPAQAQVMQAKLSPLTQLFLQDYKVANGNSNTPPPHYAYRRGADGNLYLKAMIRTTPALNEAALMALGISTGTRAGAIRTVTIPVAQLQAMTRIPGISYIQLDEPMANNMDAARRVTRTDSVHMGAAPLPMPYTGKGVVVGILDAGFDYNHPTLRDTTGNRFRITRLWEQKTVGTPPAGYSYGNELTDSVSIKAAGSDKPSFSHGTHVAGITAGSGYGSTLSQYRGIAFESELMIVGITPDSTQWIETGVSDIVDGMNYVYEHAAAAGKPAVVNLSWGTTLGPHDGTALFSQACDALTGPGKIFVCSGGNNGADKIHIGKTFSGTDTLLKTVLQFSTEMNKTWLDVWGDTAHKYCLNITLYKGGAPISRSPDICLDNKFYSYKIVGSDGDTCFVDVVTDSATFNDKPRMFFRFTKETTDQVCLTVTAKTGRVHMWSAYVANATGYYGGFVTGGVPDAVSGDYNVGTGDVADTKSAITVASFSSKVAFTNINGVAQDYSTYAPMGSIAPYSSKGPTIDGRIKPDIAGPGLFIGSGVNSLDTSYSETGTNSGYVMTKYHDPVSSRDYYYAMMTGTSMSSPVVAGIVALMLQANPGLTPQKIQSILNSTAIKDSRTGTIPAKGSNTWGHGKVNAFAAVNGALEALGLSHSSGIPALDCLLFPNPNNGTFRIRYTGNNAETLTVSLFDITGKQLSSESWQVSPGSNEYGSSKVMTPGIYFTRISAPSRGNILIRTVIR